MIKGLKVALVQMAVGSDKAKNLAVAVSEIYKAKEKGAQLVALPESFNSPYGTKYFSEYAEYIPCGETSMALSNAAAGAGVCVVGGTFPERVDRQLFNTCTVWDNCGQLIAMHRKMHLFDISIPGKITFKESSVLSPGDSVTMFYFCGIRIGLGICYDLRFYELAAVMALKGCSLIMYPSAFNTITGPKHWELLGRGRANDFQLWVALVSPARDDTAEYVSYANSMLIDPWAEVVGRLGDKPETLHGYVDVDIVQQVRSQIPVRTQKRTDVYNIVTSRKSLI